MIDVESPAVTRVTDGRGRSAGILVAQVVCYGWCLYIWPIPVLVNNVAPWPIPAAYLVVVTGLVAACFYRAARVALVISDSGLVVRNFLRSWRVGWPEIARLVDGCAFVDDWALTVLLADGHALTSTATITNRLANPGWLTALGEHAARHAVPADLSGIAAWRRRAWEDTASSARWYKARLTILLVVTAAAIAGLVVVSAWNNGHHDVGPVFLPAACPAVAALTCTSIVWVKWRQALRPDPARRDDYGEGDWFAVPLAEAVPHAEEVHAVGVIARRQQHGRGVMLGYFFGPFDLLPALDQLAELRPADAVLVREFANAPIRYNELAKSGSWPRLGKVSRWDRAAWPVPVFKRTDPKTKQSYKVFCDDELKFVREEPASRKQTRGLPPWILMNELAVKTTLNQRLAALDAL
jgi:hypothetical protein